MIPIGIDDLPRAALVAGAATPTGGVGALLHEWAVLGMAAVGAVLLFVAKGWMSPRGRGRIRFHLDWHGRRTAGAVGAIAGGLGALLYFGPRLASDFGSAGPAVLVAVGTIAAGAVALTWSARWSTRRRVWGGVGALTALLIVGSVAGPVAGAISAGLGQAGEAAGRAGAATARAAPYVIGFLVLAAGAGLAAHWMADRSRDQMFTRVAVFLVAAAVLVVVLLLTGVLAPADLFAGTGRPARCQGACDV